MTIANLRRLATGIATAALLFSSAHADTALPAPEGPALLTITGTVGLTNGTSGDQPAALLDRGQLEGLPQHTVKTSTDWTDGVVTFKGPLARDVLDLIQADGTKVAAIAANDYRIDIPVDDFRRYDVLMAMTMNGKRMSLRDKGPIWIVYPRDDHPELMDPAYNGRWIWQLVRLELE